MRSKFSPKMQVVKKEEKEGKIRSFIEKALLAVAGVASRDTLVECSLLARSTESPAARMLAAVLTDLEIAHAARVRTIVTTADAGSLRIEEPAVSIAALGECRLSTDPRLLEAHEQLVIGEKTVWIGDCMRRDPARRDAYEFYSDECVDTVEAAGRSFEKLWVQAAPVARRESGFARQAEELAPGVVPPQAGPDAPPPPTAATRH